MVNFEEYQHGIKDLPLPNRPSILIVEDEADMRANLSELLRDKFQIFTAATSKEALAIYEREQASLDLVLLDLHLPDADGTDTLNKMKKISLRPDIIVVTVMTDLDSAIKTMKLGAYDYITKPFFSEDIIGTVNRAMEKKDYTRKLTVLSEALEKERIAWQRRQILLKELEMKRRLEGKKISPEEMLLFDFPFAPEEYEFKQFKEKLEFEVGQKADPKTEKSVLLTVEDEADMRQNLKELLEAYFNVIGAATGNEALEMVKANKPDIILLDIRLPDASGIDLIPQFHKINPDADIILLTALRDVDTAVKGMKAGAYDFITKPFYSADLISTVERAVDKRHHRKLINSLLGKLEDKKLSIPERVKMLKELLAKRKAENKKLSLEDVFCFFPEYKDMDLDPSYSLPDFPDSFPLDQFLEKLRLRKEEREKQKRG